MIEFKDLTLQNWNYYEPLILKTEESYPVHLRSEKDDFLELLSEKNISKMLFVDSQFAGFVTGYPLDEEVAEDHGVNKIECHDKVYLFDIAIAPEFRGKHLAKIMLTEFIKNAKDNKFGYVLGHFRRNASLNMIKELGGREIKVCPNWEESGEDFSFCELKVN